MLEAETPEHHASHGVADNDCIADIELLEQRCEVLGSGFEGDPVGSRNGSSVAPHVPRQHPVFQPEQPNGR